MVISAARNKTKTMTFQTLRQRGSILDNLLLILFKTGRERFQKTDRFGGNNVYQWSALHAGKDRAIELFRKLFLAHRHTGARPSQGFMRGRGGKIDMRHGRGMETGGNQTGNMRDIGHYQRL